MPADYPRKTAKARLTPCPCLIPSHKALCGPCLTFANFAFCSCKSKREARAYNSNPANYRTNISFNCCSITSRLISLIASVSGNCFGQACTQFIA